MAKYEKFISEWKFVIPDNKETWLNKLLFITQFLFYRANTDFSNWLSDRKFFSDWSIQGSLFWPRQPLWPSRDRYFLERWVNILAMESRSFLLWYILSNFLRILSTNFEDKSFLLKNFSGCKAGYPMPNCGSGNWEYPGTVFSLPYWIAVFEKFI